MATELITNGSFETATGTVPTGWTATGHGKFNNWETGVPNGKAIYGFSVGSADHGGTLQQTIATVPGKTYTISYKAGVSWQAGTGQVNAGLQLDILNGSSLIETQDLTLPMNKAAGYLTYTFTFTATSSQTTIKFTDTSPNGQADFDVGLDMVSVQEAPPIKQTGEWGDILDWPLIGLHAVITQDGKLLTFGTDGKSGTANFQSAMIHDVWDPVTGQHHTLDHTNTAKTDVFCSAAIILPGTNQIIIGGGDMPQAGNQTNNKDSTIYDYTTHQMTESPEGDLHTPRWYPTMISLPTGQIVVMGGTAGGYTEIFTPGEGWRELKNVPTSTFNDGNAYPRAWVGNNGDIYVFATGAGSNNIVELKAIDVSGNGSVRAVGNLPFLTDGVSPAIMYDAGKVLVMASNGELWTMDINGATPVYTKIGLATADRNYSNMTVLANGDVLINGGTTSGNNEAPAVTKAMIFDPDTGTLSSAGTEAHARVYHGASVLLPDGSVISLGSGSAGMAETNYLDAQIYKPPYLFDANGNPAVRPDIVAAPDVVAPGQTFTITVDNAAAIKDFTFIKTGATTHTFNMDARAVDVTFKMINATTIEVTLPSDVNAVAAGSWMLFAWNDKGVPSIAEMVAVKPMVTHYEADGSGGELIGATAPTYGASILVNGGLENGVAAGSNSLTAAMPGWTAEKYVETWSKGFLGVTGTGGQTFVEIDAGTGGLSQTVKTEAGKSYQLAFDLAGRSGAIASSKVDVYWNNEKVATISPTDANWKNYTFAVTGTGGNDKLSFRPVAGDTDGAGGLLDSVTLRPQNAVEPTNPGGGHHNHNLLANGSFETTTGRDWSNSVTLANGEVGPWHSSNDRIVLWQDGVNRVRGTDGRNTVQISYESGELSQTVKTEAGKYYGISFDYAASPHMLETSKMEVLWNGVVIATITPDTALMKNYHLHVHGTGGNDVLSFRAVAGDTDNIGGILDKVELYVSGHGETPLNVINASAEGGYVAGTEGADHFKGGAANDVFYASKGNDIVDGAGGEYNQVDLDGSAADWTFTRNADGSVKAVNVIFGTKTLIEIDGVFFYGSESWSALDSLIATDPGTPGNLNMVHASASGGYLTGTAGADHFMGGAGNDVFYGGKGNDIFDGAGGDYNQVDLDGAATDWSFTRNSDGTVTATRAGWGMQTLKEIDGVFFYGSSEWKALGDLAPASGGSMNVIQAAAGGGYYAGTDGADHFKGGAGDDTFYGRKGNDLYEGGSAGYDQVNLDGLVDEWSFTQNADGSVKAHHAVYGDDTLKDIDGIWFGDANVWKALDDIIG